MAKRAFSLPAVVNLEETTNLRLQFDKRGGLLPVIVQETISGQILMLAYANTEAFELTLEKGLAYFWSTSRQRIWLKGETSGNIMQVDKILVDCDQDALVYQVTPAGDGACHTFSRSGHNRKACFYRVYKSSDQLDFINLMK